MGVNDRAPRLNAPLARTPEGGPRWAQGQKRRGSWGGTGTSGCARGWMSPGGGATPGCSRTRASLEADPGRSDGRSTRSGIRGCPQRRSPRCSERVTLCGSGGTSSSTASGWRSIWPSNVERWHASNGSLPRDRGVPHRTFTWIAHPRASRRGVRRSARERSLRLMPPRLRSPGDVGVLQGRPARDHPYALGGARKSPRELVPQLRTARVSPASRPVQRPRRRDHGGRPFFRPLRRRGPDMPGPSEEAGH